MPLLADDDLGAPEVDLRADLVGAAIAGYADAGATEVLLSSVLGTTFEDALRAAAALT
jgi:hypothetical protein